jgi:hypothetical protein
MKAWGALVLLLLAPVADDTAAKELFESIRERCLQAKTLKIEFEGTSQAYTSSGVIKIKGEDRFVLELRLKTDSGEVKTSRVASDGRKAAGQGIDRQRLDPSLTPGQMVSELRKQAVAGGYTRIWIMPGMDDEPRREPAVSGFKDGGLVPLGGRETRLIEYAVEDAARRGMAARPFKVKLYVDPATRLPVARDIDFGGAWVKSRLKFALDEEIPDAEFSLQTKRGLAAARLGQLADSVRLYAQFTGRYPTSLDDLVRRPAFLEPEIFWPEGGFALGAWGPPFELAIKESRATLSCADLAIELPPAMRRPVGAPTDRLRKHYTARVQLALLASAVRAYRDAYAELPRKKSVLWEKPEWAEVWPEGGWIPGGALPVDPWGDAYRIISEPGRVRIQLRDPRANVLGAKALTEGERQALEEVARPRLSDEDRLAVARLLDQLGEDDLEAREKAEGALKGWGVSALGLIDARLAGEKDAEVAGRLRSVRKAVPPRKPAWQSELGILALSVGPDALGPAGDVVANERNATACLKNIATAEADFRANDRDNNKHQDFWTGDVASLYTLVPEGGREAIKLIELSVAAADAAPLEDGAAIEKLAERQPRAGYCFQAMEKDASVTPAEEYPKDTTGKGSKTRNTSRFGFCCFPAEYGVTGRKTYIISEMNTIFWKDTGGEPVLEWPGDADGWQKLD